MCSIRMVISKYLFLTIKLCFLGINQGYYIFLFVQLSKYVLLAMLFFRIFQLFYELAKDFLSVNVLSVNYVTFTERTQWLRRGQLGMLCYRVRAIWEERNFPSREKSVNSRFQGFFQMARPEARAISIRDSFVRRSVRPSVQA